VCENRVALPLAHGRELSPCLPGIRPFIVADRVADLVVSDEFAVVCGEFVFPVGGTIGARGLQKHHTPASRIVWRVGLLLYGVILLKRLVLATF